LCADGIFIYQSYECLSFLHCSYHKIVQQSLGLYVVTRPSVTSMNLVLEQQHRAELQRLLFCTTSVEATG